MDLGLAVHLARRGQQQPRLMLRRQIQQVERADDIGEKRVLGIRLIVRRRGRAGQVIDVGEMKVARHRDRRLDHVMLDQLEAGVAVEMAEVLAAAGEEIVDADDARALGNQAVAQMRADKARPAGNERDLVLNRHQQVPPLTGGKRLPAGTVPERGSELLGQLGHDLEQVADQADVRDLEDRRFLVLVDGDDGLRILHSGEVLDRARNADRDIDLRSDDLAGLADLIVVGRIARIDRGAARADRRAELVGERIEQRVELFRRAERAAARHDDLGAGQLGPLALRLLEPRRTGSCLHRQQLRPVSTDARTALGGRLFERRGADGDDLLGVLGLDRRDRVAGVDRARERIAVLDRQDVADLHHVEQCGDARRDVLAGRRGRREERVVALHQLGSDRRDRFGELVLERG